MSGELEVSRRDPVAILTLSNPRRRNALDPPLLEALVAVLSHLPGEGVRAVVLTGAGETAFSSGYDVNALPDDAPAAAPPLARALAAITEGPLPVIAALNGMAIGGGCELAATCDLRVAHPGVALAMPPVKLGLVYSASGLQRFVSLIGGAHTRELFLTAQPISAERALAWGLVDHLVPREEVLPAALALADEIARHAPLAVSGTRRVLERLLAPLSPATVRELETLQREAYQSADAREARAAFLAKRPPRFTGK